MIAFPPIDRLPRTRDVPRAGDDDPMHKDRREARRGVKRLNSRGPETTHRLKGLNIRVSELRPRVKSLNIRAAEPRSSVKSLNIRGLAA